MSKRHQPFYGSDLNHQVKKSRLGVTINKGTRVNPQQIIHKVTNEIPPKLSDFQNQNFPAGTSSFWDDDDDDVLLLATQAAETQAYKITTPLADNNTHITGSAIQEISFSDFLPPLGSSTSTQRTLSQIAPEALLKRVFSDDDFGLERKEDFKNKRQLQRDHLWPNASQCQQTEDANKTHKFIKGNKTLLQNEISPQRKEHAQKIDCVQLAHRESQMQIEQLAKKVEAKKTELQLKSVEISVKTIADEGNVTRKNELIEAKNNSQLNSSKFKRMLVSVMRLHVLISSTEIIAINEFQPFHKFISPLYTKHLMFSPEKHKIFRQGEVFFAELCVLQTVMAQMHLIKSEYMLSHDLEVFFQYIKSSVSKVFPEFQTYTHNLSFPHYKEVRRYRQEIGNFDHQTSGTDSIMCLSHYLKTLSAVCYQFPNIAKKVFFYSYKKSEIFNLLIDSICKLGFSRELLYHNKLLHSCAIFCRTVFFVALSDEDLYNLGETLIDFIRHMLLVLPTSHTLHEISYCVLECINKPKLLSMLCCNCPSNIILSVDQSFYCFRNETCFLEIYFTFLETIFAPQNSSQESHSNLLYATSLNHLRFVYHCLMQHTGFILKCLHSKDNLTNNEASMNYPYNSQTKPSRNKNPKDIESVYRNTCQCYAKMCANVVLLVFQSMQQWILAEKGKGTRKALNIAKISVQLLYLIFCDNYITRLFYGAEGIISHYLLLIINWWKENTTALKLSKIDDCFIQKLQSCNVLTETSNKAFSINNLNSDMAVWYGISDESKKSFANELGNSPLCKHVMNQATDSTVFFEGLNGYAFNFENGDIRI